MHNVGGVLGDWVQCEEMQQSRGTPSFTSPPLSLSRSLSMKKRRKWRRVSAGCMTDRQAGNQKFLETIQHDGICLTKSGEFKRNGQGWGWWKSYTNKDVKKKLCRFGVVRRIKKK